MKSSRVFSILMLGISLVALFFALKKPEPVGHPLPAKLVAVNAQVFEHKLAQLETPRAPGHAPEEVHFSGEEVSAALMQAAGQLPPPPNPRAAATTTPVRAPQASPKTPAADEPFAPGQPVIKDYQISFEGEITRGQFLTQIAGKDVYVTLAGRLGSQNGYITFDPTEFKVGELNVPVVLVEGELHKKLAEQREQLRLPDDVSSIRVEDGELVMTQKW
jgi:hypothetical protein